MKQAGRVSLLSIIVIAAVLIGGAVLVLLHSSDSPESAAATFMTALAKGDVNTLTNLSYVTNETPDEIRKQWDFAENHAGKYYCFSWEMTSSLQSDASNAAISMQFVKNLGKPASYPETVNIPLVKDQGTWKVDVAAVDRTLFPALPH